MAWLALAVQVVTDSSRQDFLLLLGNNHNFPVIKSFLVLLVVF
jgi:hypothetical protein